MEEFLAFFLLCVSIPAVLLLLGSIKGWIFPSTRKFLLYAVRFVLCAVLWELARAIWTTGCIDFPRLDAARAWAQRLSGGIGQLLVPHVERILTTG
jgi:hypothetical protein